jgi:F-type H+-transporting ATPase subunit b
MESLFLIAAAAPAEGGGIAETIAKTFGWNAQLFVSQLISFLIVAFLLQKFAFKPILAMLDDRRKKIEESLSNAEKIKAELAQAESTRKQLISDASAQANKIIEEARAAAADIIAKAKQANDAELVRMKVELRKEVTRLVVDVSTSVTGGILSVDQKQRLAEDANKQLANN